MQILIDFLFVDLIRSTVTILEKRFYRSFESKMSDLSAAISIVFHPVFIDYEINSFIVIRLDDEK